MNRRQFVLSSIRISSSVVASVLATGSIKPCPYCNSILHSASHHEPNHQENSNHDAAN